MKNGETFGTGIQPAAVEGALAVRTAAKFIANGKIEGDVIQMEVDARRAGDRSRPAGQVQLHAARPGDRRRRRGQDEDLGLQRRRDLRQLAHDR